MFDPVTTQSVWFRMGITAVLVVLPTLCLLAGYRALRWVRHDGLAERMVEDGYAHPGVDDFLDPFSTPGAASDGGTVTCGACDAPTCAGLETCHVCGSRM